MVLILCFLFPVQARIAKRDRKLVDYDSARHNYAATHKSKKKDGGIKITKVNQQQHSFRPILCYKHENAANYFYNHSHIRYLSSEYLMLSLSLPAFHFVGEGDSGLGSGYLVCTQYCPEQSVQEPGIK